MGPALIGRPHPPSFYGRRIGALAPLAPEAKRAVALAEGEPSAGLALVGFEPVGPLGSVGTTRILQNRSSCFPYASQFGARCRTRESIQRLSALNHLSGHQRGSQTRPTLTA